MSHQICVLLPCFNASGTIAATINSLLRQTFVNYRCCIIDNCSTDETVQVIESLVLGDIRFTIFENECNLGGPDSFFKLPEISDAPFSMFLAADDYLHPDCLNRLHRLLLDAPRAACAVPRTMRFRGDEVEFLSDGTYTIDSSNQLHRLLAYLGSVTDNSRFYGLYRTEVLRASNIFMNFFAADLVFTALTLCFGSHLEVSGASGSPLLWRELPASMRKYIQFEKSLFKSLLFLVFPFFEATCSLRRRIPITHFFCILPCLAKVNITLSWFIFRSILASSRFFRFFRNGLTGR